MKRLAVLIAVMLGSALGGCAANGAGPVVSRIAFGSCAKQDRPQPIWEAVVDSRPDLFLFIGDAVYADTEDMQVMRSAYAKLAAVPGYRKLGETCPILATWDDHEYGVDDGGAEYPQRAESQRVFLEALGETRHSARWERAGVYDARLFGPANRRVQVILLDTRYFRGPLARGDSRLPGVGPYVPGLDTSVTMLGAAQWRWLEAQLRVPARLRIIASSIQVLAEGHGWEKWMNLPHERRRLFELIRDCKADGVMFISGDRHFAELSVMDADLGYPVYDLTSSGLNCGLPGWYVEPNRHRVGEIQWCDNFGLITIDWDQPDPEICLEIRRVDGSVALRHCVNLSEVGAGSAGRSP